jgi:hypothetical protein
MANKYNMNHAKRGIALIINIRSYNPNPYNLAERRWSQPDVVNLKKTLEYLEFDLRFYENLTANEIREEIEKIADKDHTDSDCFLCVVMSHGDDGKIIANDSEEISFLEIMEPIKSCKSLDNKPKLFFFQASRGKNKMEPKNHRPDSGVSKSLENTPDDHKEERTSNNNDNRNNLKQITSYLENEADLLVYYSTIPDHYAHDTVVEGTLFIKSVCKELNEAYKNLPNNMSLGVMILNINKSIRDKGMQLPHLIIRLARDVNFTPKKVSFYLSFIVIQLNNYGKRINKKIS